MVSVRQGDGVVPRDDAFCFTTMASASLTVLVVCTRASKRGELCERIRDTAQSSGFATVLEAADSRSAVATLSSRSVDVVLLELVQSDEEHDTLHDLLRASPDIPIVIVSDSQHESAAISAMRSGAHDYVIDDVDDTRILWRALRNAIDRTTAMRRQAAADHRAAFLAEASAAVCATLDPRAVLSAALRQLVPRFGKGAAAFSVVDDGTLALVDTRHDRSSKGEHLLAVSSRIAHGCSMPRAITRARRLGYVVLDTGDDTPNAGASGAQRGGDSAGKPHCVVVPLRARTRALGLLLLATRKTTRAAHAADIELLRVFAGRVASAVDHACTYEAAQRAIRTRDQVLGIVSHDLRNPLSAIGICATALQTPTHLADDERRQLAGTIGEAVDWTLRLIGDLLDVASLEGGHLSIDARALDPIILLSKSLNLFEHGTAGATVQLAAGVPDSLPRIRGDEQRILQVIANLISNARKFTPADGIITLGAELVAGAVRFRVTDSGVGLAREDQRHVFDWFWRAAHERQHHGTGLGLAIAKGIVEAHGGVIMVESSPGNGASFAFTIPLAEPIATDADSLMVSGIA